ncbi:hypothetical protein G6011_03427 [Alternaria panax]|uniref:Uncharacterized protein n=1 Tax=Alternaria panax TaxID=48097 RepID=A0AAD4IEN8_9PLEO|nr:hypothetical protein G6011_03427 [Alternaria panax]
MVKKGRFRFFNLPTELRLEVYRRLLTDALIDGRTSDAGGLFRACRMTSSEMEPLISTIRIALDLKHTWKFGRTMLKGKVKSRIKGKLRLDLPHEHTYGKPLTKVTISVPSEPICVTQYIQTKRKVQKHTGSMLTRAISCLLSPLGYELRGRYSSKECLTSDSLFFFIFIQTWGRKFLKETRDSGQVERLVFYKDPAEDSWIVEITYATPRLHVDPVSDACAVYWDAAEVVDGSISRKFGIDFVPLLPTPMPNGDIVAWRWRQGKYNRFL